MDACSFELLNSGNSQSTVTRAAGNHDGTGKCMFAVRQLQGKVTLLSRSSHLIQPLHRGWPSRHRISVPDCRRAPSERCRKFQSESQGNFQFVRRRRPVHRMSGSQGPGQRFLPILHRQQRQAPPDQRRRPRRRRSGSGRWAEQARCSVPVRFRWDCAATVRQDTKRSAIGWDRCGSVRSALLLRGLSLDQVLDADDHCGGESQPTGVRPRLPRAR